MAGMILGVTVLGARDRCDAGREHGIPRAGSRSRCRRSRSARRRAGVRVRADEEAGPPAADAVSVPGPTLVLRRGEPVEITLVNRLSEATAIHWHGMELDSYYDGVHGWSGAGQRVTPMIEPGGSFVVRFTPPRTGTFIYHTHLHDNRQLPSGLYGAMLVVDPGETFDDSNRSRVRDGPRRAWHSGAGRAQRRARAEGRVEGGRAPSGAADQHHTDDIFTVTLQTTEGPVTWRPLTKDGAPLPPDRCQPRPAKQ